MLLNEYKLIEIFCSVDDFCKLYEEKLLPPLLPSTSTKKPVNKPSISLSQMMVIELLYHLSRHKCFQYYYEMEVLKGSLRRYFPKAPSYNRFVELKPRILMALIAYLHLCRIGLMLQIYYADGTVASHACTAPQNSTVEVSDATKVVSILRLPLNLFYYHHLFAVNDFSFAQQCVSVCAHGK
jgi:hypothetical protein